jgi:hypothetical protein
MKQVLLLCLIGIAALDIHAATGNPPQPVQPFTAVLWTTTTLHSPAGKPSVFMRRTVYTRDASGNTRREIYQPTRGLLHDVPARTRPDRLILGKCAAYSPIEQRYGGAGCRSGHLAVFRSARYGQEANIPGRQWSAQAHSGDMVFRKPGTDSTHGKQQCPRRHGRQRPLRAASRRSGFFLR